MKVPLTSKYRSGNKSRESSIDQDKLQSLLGEIPDQSRRQEALSFFKAILQETRNFNIALKGTRDTYVDIVKSSQEQVEATLATLQETSRTNQVLGLYNRSMKKILDISTKVRDNDLDIENLTVSQLENLKAKAKSALQGLEDASGLLMIQKGITDLSEEAIKNNDTLSKSEKEILRTRLTNFENLKNSLTILEERTESQKEFNEIGGLTTTLLSNLNRVGLRVFGGIGLNLDSIKQAFEDVNKDVRTQISLIQATAKAEGETLDSQKKRFKQYKIFRKSLKGIGGALVETLADPLITTVFSIDQIVKRFKAINEQSVAFSRLTGQNISLQASFNTKLVTASEYIKLASELTKQLGFNVNNAFSEEVLGSVAELTTYLGISSEQAGKLAIFSGTNSKSVDQNLDTLVDTVSTYNGINRTVVSQGVVLQDVLNTSDDIAASFGGQVDKLAEAGAAARRLGLELKELDGIAGSLLDFESSIGAELEAQILTGRNINLTRARELALSNDLAGVGKELFDNSASLLEFSSMNRIQQDAQAKALGLSRQQLAKIALQRSIELGITNEQLEAAAGVTAEDLKRVEAFKTFTIAIEKLGAALAGPADLLATMMGNTFSITTALSGLAGLSFLKLLVQLKTMRAQLAKSASFAWLSRAALFPTALIGLPIVMGGITALLNRMNNDSMNDGMISPEGLVVQSPKGSIQLNKDDSIIAGTNLFSKEKPGLSKTNLETSKALVEQSRSMKRMETLLENILTKTGNVYIDGNKAGEAMVLSTYKLS